MYQQIKLRRTGGSTAVTLPENILERSGLNAGDEAIASADRRWLFLGTA